MNPSGFQLAQRLCSCLGGIRVSMLAEQEENSRKLLDGILPGVVPSEQAARFFREQVQTMMPGCVYGVQGLADTWSVCLRINGNFLIAGPCRTESRTEKEIRQHLHSRGFSDKQLQKLLDMYLALPLLSYEALHRLGSILAEEVFGLEAPVPFRSVQYKWEQQAKQALLLAEHYEDIGKMRMVEQRYEGSAAFTEAVKQGNLSLAYSFVRQMRFSRDGLKRNADPLRNAQNLCIILNTQLRHALEENGIHPYRLDQVSGSIALQIEALQSQNDAEKFLQEITRRYCTLAQETAYPDLQPLSRLAVTYIKDHLSDNLTVKDTAKALLVNPDYLSYRFHLETGLPFTDFVNRERTGQAAALLKHTNLQIQQIAAAVGYNNTSYFTRQFRKFHAMTPQLYRKKGAL